MLLSSLHLQVSYTAAAHLDFAKFLRWTLVSDNKLNTMPQSKD